MPAITSFYYLSPPLEHPVPTEEGALLHLALAINGGSSIKGLVDNLFESLNGWVPYDRIGLGVLEAGGKLRIAHVRSKRRIIWGEGASAPLAGTSMAPILRDNKIRIINDMEAYLEEHPHSETGPQILAEGIRSSLTLPVSTANGPIGLIFFSSVKPYAYGPAHVDLLRLIAAGLGIAFERAKLVDDLRAANRQLKELDKLKTNFLSTLSHELRTPLNFIMAYASVLDDEVEGRLNEAQRHGVDAILEGAERLKGQLDDLFEFINLESPHPSLSRVPLELDRLVHELVEEARPGLTADGYAVRFEAPDAPVIVNGDGPLLAHAIQALLDNAHKFTPAPGAIGVSVSVENGHAVVAVSDTGIGIAPAYHARVFEKFFQVDGGATRAHGGAGLGLALVKAIVLAHGGRVDLRSTPGQGSVFSVTLPRLTIH